MHCAARIKFRGVLTSFHRWETTQIPSLGQKGRGSACCMKHQGFLLAARVTALRWRGATASPSSLPAHCLAGIVQVTGSPSITNPSSSEPIFGPQSCGPGRLWWAVTAVIMHAVAPEQDAPTRRPRRSQFPWAPGETPDMPAATPHTVTKLSRSVTRVSLDAGQDPH